MVPRRSGRIACVRAGFTGELARKDIELAANAAEIHAKALHVEKLKMQLAVLRLARFGSASSTVISNNWNS